MHRIQWRGIMRRRGELSTDQKNLVRAKITDEEAFERFERDALIRDLRPASIKFYKNELHSAKVAIESMELNKQLVELNQTDIENLILFLKDQIKIVSINTRIRAMKTFFNYLHKNNLVKPNPMKNIRQLRDRQKIMETLENEEIILLANHMKEQNTFVCYRDFVIFLLMLDTGVRLSETVGIKVEDIVVNGRSNPKATAKEVSMQLGVKTRTNNMSRSLGANPLAFNGGW
jgi:site-specific recombinase XerD